MKKITLLLIASFTLFGCAGYFSKTHTSYRIETTTGDRYYSGSPPQESVGTYTFEDLDGNDYTLPKGSISKVEKFTHKK